MHQALERVRRLIHKVVDGKNGVDLERLKRASDRASEMHQEEIDLAGIEKRNLFERRIIQNLGRS